MENATRSRRKHEVTVKREDTGLFNFTYRWPYIHGDNVAGDMETVRTRKGVVMAEFLNWLDNWEGVEIIAFVGMGIAILLFITGAIETWWRK